MKNFLLIFALAVAGCAAHQPRPPKPDLNAVGANLDRTSEGLDDLRNDINSIPVTP